MRLNLSEDRPFVFPSSDFDARCRASIFRNNAFKSTLTLDSILKIVEVDVGRRSYITPL